MKNQTYLLIYSDEFGNCEAKTVSKEQLERKLNSTLQSHRFLKSMNIHTFPNNAAFIMSGESLLPKKIIKTITKMGI